MTTHHLKTWASEWDAVARGDKTFEVRRNDDRDFAVGDELVLQKWDPAARPSLLTRGAYVEPHSKWITSDPSRAAHLRVRVTHILHGGRFGLPDGVCVMSIVRATMRGEPEP